MKTQSFRKVMITGSMIMLLSAVTAWAQPGRGQGKGLGQGYVSPGMQTMNMCENLPGITEEQLDQISTLRVAHLQKRNTLRNDVDVKRAELVQLETADNTDIELINSKIDEIYAVKAQLAKERSQHRQQVKSHLTEAQKVYFDARRGGRGYGMGNKAVTCHNRGKGMYRCRR